MGWSLLAWQSGSGEESTVQNSSYASSGGFALWSLATWSDQAKLQSRFQAIGIGNYAPKPMAPSAVLREALEKVFGRKTENAWAEKKCLVRPLSEANGFCVLKEERGKERNLYPQVLMCKIDPETMVISFAPLDSNSAEVAREFNEHRKWVPGSQVGSSLVDLVKMLGGIAIRKSGGLYWLPARSFGQWRQIGEAVEACSAYGKSEVYLGTMEVNADSIRLVRDSIKTEILQESTKLMDEIAKGEPGEKAIKARLAYIDQLEAKVKEYEGIVGESMVDLREALNQCATAAGLAAFQIVAEDAA